MLILILELTAAIANYICIGLFIVQNAFIRLFDFVLDHNKGLEEKMYRKGFGRRI